jgi:hypothetical protein
MLLYVQSSTPDDGWKDRLTHVECYSKINKYEKLVHLVGFAIEIYYDALTYERQICKMSYYCKFLLMIEIISQHLLLPLFFISSLHLHRILVSHNS